MTARTLTIEYLEYNDATQLPAQEEALVARAWEARNHAHAPYSNFQVGAAVLTREGTILVGSNQETANYKGSCAEKVALDSAGALGLKNQVSTIAIVGDHSSLTIPLAEQKPVSPCGQCCQDIKEAEDLSKAPITIILASPSKIIKVVGVRNLLPFAFGPADLGVSFE